MIKLIFSLCFVGIFSLNAQISIPANQQSKTIDTVKTEIDLSNLKIVRLPRPISETWSYGKAKKRRDEIYNLHPTKKYFHWKNPTSGGAVHINKSDEIEVYQFTLGIYQYSNDTGVFYTSAPKDTFVIVKNAKDLLHYVGGIGEGNPSSVLITSEMNLHKSKAIKKVMEELWTPGIQLYYITKK